MLGSVFVLFCHGCSVGAGGRGGGRYVTKNFKGTVNITFEKKKKKPTVGNLKTCPAGEALPWSFCHSGLTGVKLLPEIIGILHIVRIRWNGLKTIVEPTRIQSSVFGSIQSLLANSTQGHFLKNSLGDKWLEARNWTFFKSCKIFY